MTEFKAVGFKATAGADRAPGTPENRGLGARGWAAATLIAVLGSALRVGVLAIFARANQDSLWGLLNKWDAQYYTEIARAGYFGAEVGEPGKSFETAMAFFPGFPLVIRALASLGINESAAAMLLNLIFLSVLAAGVMAIAARMGAGFPGRVAAAIVVTSAPMSIVLSMPYTEALFGALLMWGLVALHDERWWLAGAAGFALSFVRLTAVDFLAVFALMVLLRAVRNWRAWCALVLAALPLVGYLTWANQHLAHLGGYFGTQRQHWNSHFDFGAATMRWAWTVLTTGDNVGYLLSVSVIIAVPILLVLSWGKLPPAVWWFSAALTANVVLSDGIMHSRPRLLLPTALVLLPWILRAAAAPPRRGLWWAVAAWVLWGAWFSGYMLAVFEWAI
ncbi:mannosyltransferase family protein [Corynebacterium sp.]|uniref:mannosyltransferase family protein n=1 Tax=Corynebacterium sp. TaxID=1720 RepID=UPI0026DD170A|nr:mannosyltransferase family protein [Corynebacterium sp.]MDO5031835.1 mannosyltransferase family protein [Corynebacterium sp.]